MRCVFSQWSKPVLTNTEKICDFGFGDLETYLWSCALSVELAKKQFKEIYFICDDYAKIMLVDKLGLPFTNVVQALDKINDKNPRIWSYGKFETYKIMSNIGEPFIHVDNDLFLYSKLTGEELSRQFLFWMAENNVKNSSLYSIGADYVRSSPSPPLLFKNSDLSNLEFSLNMGIFLVNRIDILKEYLDIVFKYLCDPLNLEFFKNSQDKLSYLPITIEQYLLSMFLQSKNIDIGFLNTAQLKEYGDTSLSLLSAKKILHFAGSNKRIYGKNIIQRANLLCGNKYRNKIKQINQEYVLDKESSI